MVKIKKQAKKTNTKLKKSIKAINTLNKEKQTKELSLKQNLYDQLKLSESYVSLILGAVVVLVISVIFFVFIQGNNSFDSKQVLPAKNAAISPAASVSPQVSKKIYTLQEDESLWDVAVKFYGDGFRWVDIAKANHLEDIADYVEPGTRLIIPNVK